MCPVTRFFAVETNLSFWWDLEKFSQKSVPSHMFLRSADYLKFLMGLRKIFTKECAQSYVSSLWRLTWVFDGTRKKFLQKSVPIHTFLRCGDYLKFLRGLGKFRQKGVTSYTFFFAVQSILSFWWDLEKISQKSVPSYTFCSQWRLS